MNVSQVRAKSRRAMRKLEDEYVQEEMEGGELNLVPYLDIVTNLTLFLLASISSGLLGNLNAAVPPIADKTVGAKSPTTVEDKGLGMIVAVTKTGLKIFSIADTPPIPEEINLPIKANVFEPAGLQNYLNKLQAELLAKDPKNKVKYDATEAITLAYDWDTLGAEMKKIRDANPIPQPKKKPDGSLDYGHSREVILMPHGEIPYDTLVRAMDTLRPSFPDVMFSPGVK